MESMWYCLRISSSRFTTSVSPVIPGSLSLRQQQLVVDQRPQQIPPLRIISLCLRPPLLPRPRLPSPAPRGRSPTCLNRLVVHHRHDVFHHRPLVGRLGSTLRCDIGGGPALRDRKLREQRQRHAGGQHGREQRNSKNIGIKRLCAAAHLPSGETPSSGLSHPSIVSATALSSLYRAQPIRRRAFLNAERRTLNALLTCTQPPASAP